MPIWSLPTLLMDAWKKSVLLTIGAVSLSAERIGRTFAGLSLPRPGSGGAGSSPRGRKIQVLAATGRTAPRGRHPRARARGRTVRTGVPRTARGRSRPGVR
jgi:hypothetical protein